MTRIALTLDDLVADGFIVRRSGIRWLRSDQHICSPNEIIGYCNISLEPRPGHRPSRFPLADEPELQVAFAPRIGGKLHLGSDQAPGGYLSIFGLQPWNPTQVLGELEPEAGAEPGDGAGSLRLLLLAGRRMTELADVEFGLLPGWHSRSRAWWSAGKGEITTLLSLGICDAAGVIRGTESPFVETFAATTAPMQIVYVPDHPLLPCSVTLREQLLRTTAQNQAISADMMQGIAAGASVPEDKDWLFAGALLSALKQSPMQETYDVLTSTGLHRIGPADAVLLSLSAEPQTLLRHRKLGYSIQMLRHRQAAAGPAVQAWLNSAFETVKRTADDVRRDYLALAETLKEKTGARLLILNRMSTSGFEDISTYMPFDAPLSQTLENVAAKEMNLMLHDLGDECDAAIVDVDAVAAYAGGGRHLPDGIHHSGEMQNALRAEILRILEVGETSPAVIS